MPWVELGWEYFPLLNLIAPPNLVKAKGQTPKLVTITPEVNDRKGMRMRFIMVPFMQISA